MFASNIRNPWSVRLVGLGAILVVLTTTIVATMPVRQRESVAVALVGADPSRAPALMRRFGCSGCHTISGIAGADGVVGGPLDDLRRRVFIAGVLPNNADNLVRWIYDPPAVNPRTAMPATGISADEARAVAAYLYSR
jgi:cytochrome c1